jgi:hypothetical protein
LVPEVPGDRQDQLALGGYPAADESCAKRRDAAATAKLRELATADREISSNQPGPMATLFKAVALDWYGKQTLEVNPSHAGRW